MVLRLAEELGAEEALRLTPPLVRALTGAALETADVQQRRSIVRVCRRLDELGFVAGTAGNVSLREETGTVLITAAGLPKGNLRPDDLVRLGPDGTVISGTRSPSTEHRLHLAIYRRRPDVRAVVHAHPPFATGFAAAGVALDQPFLAESFTMLGPRVPLVPYGTPSTWELPQSLEPFLEEHQAFLLANHGALCLGESLEVAAHRMEILEFTARVLLTARLLGGETLLTRQQLERLARASSG